MSYSAFFTAGLTLASHPREYEHSFSLPSVQINVHPGTPPRMRRRRSSLTIPTSSIRLGTIKSPGRTANEVTRSTHCSASPREATFLELHNGTRPRRKTLKNIKDLPSLPAPTTPLPTIPSNFRIDVPRESHVSSSPITPIDDPYPSTPLSAELPRLYQPGSLRSNPARKSSFLLPMMARGALFPSAHASTLISDVHLKQDFEKEMVTDIKNAPAAVWYDDEADMKENAEGE